MRKISRFALPVLVLSVGVTACGGDGDGLARFAEPGPPLGRAVLPDLMPAPPDNLGTKRIDGRWHVSFSTVIVNVGEGDLLLRATREEGAEWKVEQLVPHSQGGAAARPMRAALAWGGDGHEHWHVRRVASVWITARPTGGVRAERDPSRIDTKVGFCFYDHTHELASGPGEAVYSSKSCGSEDDMLVGMGLSPGWNDTYARNLPGQSIDLTGLVDGRYRIWADVDEAGRFREATRANNLTWVDFELSTSKGVRFAAVIDVGPEPA